MNVSNTIEKQLQQFRSGIEPYALSRPATVNDGIFQLNTSEADYYERIYENSLVDSEKFVPASGAATRMFKSLLAWKNEGIRDSSVDKFFQNKALFPFKLADLSDQEVIHELFETRKWDQWPKGLLPFHNYPKKTRCAAEEHLIEGLEYLNKDEVSIHFTVSPEHRDKFSDHLDKFLSNQEQRFNITYSYQRPETDTIAVDLENQPIKDLEGNYVYRPAGHGALLENLNERTADIIFIKNIDNVVPERLKDETIRYKKILGGVLINYQNRIFELLNRNDRGEDILNDGRELLAEIGNPVNSTLTEIINKLNRPIRVCGMVKNQGEPGGGPFWVLQINGDQSLQIVEGAQVDKNDSKQFAIFHSSTHFNPVDIVCGIKNHKGEKFDLMKFRDPNAGFITQKFYNGLPIKALELPGLWNGSMAYWNTIFVEVPLITFNPVKTVNDLLKPEHQV